MTMRLLCFEVFVQLAVFVAVGLSGTVYITDLPIYSALGQYFHREAFASMARPMYHHFWYTSSVINHHNE
jgi:hypothetical protein